MASTSAPGILDRLFRHELARARGAVTFVTFNHDLVLENAIARVVPPKNTWCLRSLYGDPNLDQIIPEDRDMVFPHHTDSCPHTPPATVLKLHGSLNWVVRTASRQPRLGTLFPGRNKTILMHNEKEFSDIATLRSSKARGRKKWYLWPLIAPPIYDKSRITGMAVLDSLWHAAADAIRSADRLLLLGYSLPDADGLATQMLRASYFSNKSLDAVDCVDPDPALASKIGEGSSLAQSASTATLKRTSACRVDRRS
jgi:hypothetical protein